MYFEKIPRENRPEATCFRYAKRDFIMHFLMTSLAKKRLTGVENVM